MKHYLEEKIIENRIHVSVRVKPLNLEETLHKNNRNWQVQGPKSIIHLPSNETYKFGMTKHKSLYLIYSIDRVYNEDMSTSQIFEEEAR